MAERVPAVRGLGLWRVRTTLDRSATQWRLLAVVTVVALLVSTLLAALSLLLVATERTGVRSALTGAGTADLEVSVTVDRLTVPADEVRARADEAVAELTAPAPVQGAGTTSSALLVLAREDAAPALTYLGELDGLEARTRIVGGAWPTGAGTGGAVPVALPAPMAEDLGLDIGDTLEAGRTYADADPLVLEVAGTFETSGTAPAFWSADRLEGALADPAFAVPGGGGQVTTDAYGPVVAAPGVLATLPVGVDLMTVRYVPDFAGFDVADVSALVERLDRAETRLPAEVGAVGDTVRTSTDALRATAQEVGTAIVVTRASVVVVSLLLAVLAVAALLQTARLLADARSGEQNLMRARGASGRQLVGLAALEAAGLAVLTAAVSPLLARQVYLLIAQQPAMREAGMAADPGIPPQVWATAAAAALLFAVVLIAPLLRRTTTFVDGEQARARPDRRSVLTRAGLDLGLVALAGVAYWQLQSYRTPVTEGASGMQLDPVLVAGPAVVLLAGSLLCVRLVPAASRLAERIGSGGRGVVAPLAAWEVGRRSGRATAAVLLLTLALAVGTFSQSFLATWRQSQAHQAELSVGAPVRVADDAGRTPVQADLLSPDGVRAQPALRSDGELAPPEAAAFGGPPPDGRPTRVLALTAEGRAMLDAGRTADEGGREVAALDVDVPEASGVDLPGVVHGVAAEVQVGTAAEPLPGTIAILRAVLEDGDGLLHTLDLARIPVDGAVHAVEAMLPEDARTAEADGARLVGLQSVLFAVDPELAATDEMFQVPFLLRDLHTLEEVVDEGATETVRTPVDVDPDTDWYAATRFAVPMSTEPPEGWQMGVEISGFRMELQFSTPSLNQVGWPVVADLPAVVATETAARLAVDVGDALLLVMDDVVVPVTVAGLTPYIPSLGSEGLVVDQHQLARAFAQTGVARPAVGEWWVDVPDDGIDAYLAALGDDPDPTPVADRATSRVVTTQEMQQHPLRVATQGALWLVTLAAALLAAVGFAIHATVTLRARAVEFAQLRAIGLQRRRLTAVVGVESVLLCSLGAVFGIGLGALLGHLVGPLVAVSASGAPPVPSVLVLIPWADVALLAVEVVAVLAVVVLVVARTQRSADPAAVLRLGDER